MIAGQRIMPNRMFVGLGWESITDLVCKNDTIVDREYMMLRDHSSFEWIVTAVAC
jgi:hypothetical protein